MPRPKPQKKMTHVSLYVPAEAWRLFRARCIESGTSASQVLASAITARLEQHGVSAANVNEMVEDGDVQPA